MSNEVKLLVEPRTSEGTRACRALRRAGIVPGNIYGHAAEPTIVQVSHSVIHGLVYSGNKVVDVDLNGEISKAVVREIHWDALGNQVVHFDLMRVDPNERVTVHVPVELKGTAAGAVAGGIIDHQLHSITLDVLAYQIPDSIPVRIGGLEIGGVIHVRDLAVPDSAHVQHAADAIVVQIVQAKTGDDPTTPGMGAAEPEVIGKKPVDPAAAAAAPTKGKDGGKKK